MSKPPIIYFGNEQLCQGIKTPITPILDGLIASDYPITAVFVNYDPHNKSRSNRPPRVVEVASQHNIPIYTSYGKQALVDTLMPLIREMPQKPLGVLSAFNVFIPDSILEVFEPTGILNIHPSLLPLYRGTTPIESALLNDDAQTGTSIMKLTSSMDAGPLYSQIPIAISPTDTKESLYQRLAQAGADELLRILPKIHQLTPQPQPTTGATYTTKLDKSLATLDPITKSAMELHREIIAYAGFPKSKFTFFDTPCTITTAHVADARSTPLDLKCTDGKYLVIDSLIPANSREMSTSAFLTGHK